MFERNVFIWIWHALARAVTYRHLMGARNLRSAFWDKINFFEYIFLTFVIYVFVVFCGECGCICMISICVADNSYKAIFFFLLLKLFLLYFIVVK